MGKLATVVYDAVKHVPLVVRTRTSSPAERCGVIDAVAAFAHHCESLRGIARSHVHVSALWGGPPYVTYQVVQSRFRVIVMWVDAPGDFDMAQDVQDALIRLHAAVQTVADEMSRGDLNAVAHAYAVAGAALEDDFVHASGITEAGGAPVKKQSKLHVRRTGSATDSLTSTTAPEQKKGGFLRGLFAGGNDKGKRIGQKDSEHRTASTSGANGESNALSVLSSNEPIPFDDPVGGDLDLPEEVFAFSDFGAPLPQSAGSLEWVGKLIQGYEKPKAMPRPASIRQGPSADQPESSATASSFPQLPAPSGPSLTSESTSIPLSSEKPAPKPPTQVPVAAAVSAARPPVSSGTGQAIPSTPLRQTATPVLMAGPTPPSPTVRTPPPPPPLSGNAGPLPAPLPGSVAPPSGDVPEQMRNRSGSEDFDMSALGEFQDEAATKAAVGVGVVDSNSGSIGGTSSSLPPATQETIRNKMNEFANTMQSGNYPLALQQVAKTLKGLARCDPRPEREIITTASYYQALKILIRVRVLEAEMARVAPNSSEAMQRSVEMALLTMFLAESKNLLPRHSVAGKKMAVEKNFPVGNFGMCARWLRSLVDAAPPQQRNIFAQRLELCVQNRELNTHMPPSKFLCFNTLSVVAPGNGVRCGFCPSVFAPPQKSGVAPGQVCPVCLVGTTSVIV